MSTLFSPDSKFLQRFLSSGGYYNDDIDGDVGPKTLEAMGKFEAETEQVANELGSFDTRTEKSIRAMLIPTQRKARQFMKDIGQAGLSQGLTARIISGTRTFDEQNKLYAQGRTSPGNVVTNARAGYSNHNFGIAWDVGIFNKKGDYIDDLIDKKLMTSKAVDAEYKKVGAYGKACGLFWGGDWTKPDYPHFQMRDNDELASIRDTFTDGRAIV
jgi:peptidoglycan L-alanyl-D-glutamate endopeptidase CwlK